MFNNKFVAVIKSNSEVLRERQNGEIYLPFGSEYTILLKNENSRGASVKITIDNKDVLDNKRLFLLANSEIELKGFLKGNETTNSFKFIERAKEIEEYRGTKIDDGIIRIEYQFEKETVDIPIHRYHYQDHYYPHQWDDYGYWYKPYYPRATWGTIVTTTIGSTYSGSTSGSAVCVNFNNPSSIMNEGSFTAINGSIDIKNVSCYYSNGNIVADMNRSSSQPTQRSLVNSNPIKSEGITVKGSPIRQEFSQTYERNLENNSYTIVFKLVGYQEDTGIYIAKAMTVKTRSTCTTCGKECKSDENYCVRCGTWIDWS